MPFCNPANADEAAVTSRPPRSGYTLPGTCSCSVAFEPALTVPEVATASRRRVIVTGSEPATASLVSGVSASPSTPFMLSFSDPIFVALSVKRTSVGLSVRPGTVMVVGPSTVTGESAGSVSVTFASPVLPVSLCTTAPASNVSPRLTKRGREGRSENGLRTCMLLEPPPNRSAPLEATAMMRYDVRDCGSFMGTVALPSLSSFTVADHAAKIRKSVRMPSPVDSSPPPPPGSGDEDASPPLSSSEDGSATTRIRLSAVSTISGRSG